MLRAGLLWLSEQPQIFRFVRRNGLARRFASRFVAGETVESAHRRAEFGHQHDSNLDRKSYMFLLCSFLFPTGCFAAYEVIRSKAGRTRMDDSPEPPEGSRGQTLARILTEAVNSSGRPRRDIARVCGLHKNSFLRALRGTRDVTAGEAIRILDASGAPPKATLVLALTGSEELALSWMHSEAGQFFEELLARLPSALMSELGDNLTEVQVERENDALLGKPLLKDLAVWQSG